MGAVNAVRPDAVSRRLVDHAADLLAQHGPAGLSLRKLATTAGTSTMAVYTRFGDKQQLLAAMRREGFRRLGERLAATSEDPVQSMIELGRAYRLAALDSRHLYGLMFGPLPSGLQLSAQDDDTAAATFTPLVNAVRAAVDHGVLAGDAQQIALQLWVVAHGMVSLELAGMLPYPPADIAHAYDEALQMAAEPFSAQRSATA